MLLYTHTYSHFGSESSEANSFPQEMIRQGRQWEVGTEELLCPDFLKPSGGPCLQWRSFEKGIAEGFKVLFPSSCVLAQLLQVLRLWSELGPLEHEKRDEEEWGHGQDHMAPPTWGLLWLAEAFCEAWLFVGMEASFDTRLASVFLPECTRHASLFFRTWKLFI